MTAVGAAYLALNLGSRRGRCDVEEAHCRRDDRSRAAETFWGGYSAVILDPDGHPWEIAHNPHWTSPGRRRPARRRRRLSAEWERPARARYCEDVATNCETCLIWVSLS